MDTQAVGRSSHFSIVRSWELKCSVPVDRSSAVEQLHGGEYCGALETSSLLTTFGTALPAKLRGYLLGGGVLGNTAK
jgi:hypothetical protein